MEKITLSEYGYDCVQIETSSACNMACSFCPYPLKDDKTTKLPLQDIKNIIDQIDPNDKKFRHIAFHYSMNLFLMTGSLKLPNMQKSLVLKF